MCSKRSYLVKLDDFVLPLLSIFIKLLEHLDSIILITEINGIFKTTNDVSEIIRRMKERPKVYRRSLSAARYSVNSSFSSSNSSKRSSIYSSSSSIWSRFPRVSSMIFKDSILFCSYTFVPATSFNRVSRSASFALVNAVI